MTDRTPLNDDDKAATAKALEEGLHALAQPLTALLFWLELGASHTDPQPMRTTLNDARTECLRAIKALEQVRSMTHALGKLENPRAFPDSCTGTNCRTAT